MKSGIQLGIWIDTNTAHLIEYSNDPVTTKTLEYELPKEGAPVKRERIPILHYGHEDYQKAAFMGSLMERIKNYKEVVLFGPSDDRIELLNLMKADYGFRSIRTTQVKTPKLTESQHHDFVRNYFAQN